MVAGREGRMETDEREIPDPVKLRCNDVRMIWGVLELRLRHHVYLDVVRNARDISVEDEQSG